MGKVNPSYLAQYTAAYNQLKPKWTDALNLYEPVPGVLGSYLTRHPNEELDEYFRRQGKASQINALKMIVDFYLAMLFSTNIRVTAEDEYQEQVDRFVQKCNKRGDTLVDYWREQVVPQSLLYGVIDSFVDLPGVSEQVTSLAQQRELALDLPYSFIVPPLQRVRWQVDDAGQYSYYQSLDVISTQINAEFAIRNAEQYQCWTSATVFIFDKQGNVVAEKPNPFGFIPAVSVSPLPSARFYNNKIGSALVDGLIELQIETINTLSLIGDFHRQVNFGHRVITQDVTDGAQAPEEGDLKAMGNNRALLLEGQGSKFQIITPDAAGVKAMQEYLDQLLDKMFQLALIPIDSNNIKTHTSSQTIRNNLQQLFNRLIWITRHLERAMKETVEMALRVTQPNLDVRTAKVTVQWDTNYSYESFVNNLEQLAELKATVSDIAPTAVKEFTKKVLTAELFASGQMDAINKEIEQWKPTPTAPKGSGGAPVDPAQQLRKTNLDISAAAKVS